MCDVRPAQHVVSPSIDPRLGRGPQSGTQLVRSLFVATPPETPYVAPLPPRYYVPVSVSQNPFVPSPRHPIHKPPPHTHPLSASRACLRIHTPLFFSPDTNPHAPTLQCFCPCVPCCPCPYFYLRPRLSAHVCAPPSTRTVETGDIPAAPAVTNWTGSRTW